MKLVQALHSAGPGKQHGCVHSRYEGQRLCQLTATHQQEHLQQLKNVKVSKCVHLYIPSPAVSLSSTWLCAATSLQCACSDNC